ncbi:hypothetical protein RhiirA1_475354 [Rhizophagus irregularis]|uniref:Uncharacterized protein n=1 Tax=Rhizophagus irregularis TaxID=588596 RepID=A0A2N0QWZ6_9GLOM|nr:hypothetical protein RhiirA1_475354 [Rhizophagus irregularis]CAB4477796.1 unnamed protein product [Rhizophagus irregularis]
MNTSKNISENYPGQNVLISYLKKQGNKSSYCKFLNLHYNTIITSTFSDNWKNLDNTWYTYFLEEVERLDLNKVLKEKENYCNSDIFILSNTGDNYVILELKYISLVGLNRNQNNLGANELENLDKLLENENEESILKRPYSYWSKKDKKTNLTTIDEILNNGMSQLNSYMKTISKGKAINYSSSGVFDKRVKITKSNPNKLKGFVLLVIGFRRILWRSSDEVTTNFLYNKV